MQDPIKRLWNIKDPNIRFLKSLRKANQKWVKLGGMPPRDFAPWKTLLIREIMRVKMFEEVRMGRNFKDFWNSGSRSHRTIRKLLQSGGSLLRGRLSQCMFLDRKSSGLETGWNAEPELYISGDAPPRHGQGCCLIHILEGIFTFFFHVNKIWLACYQRKRIG